jgi:hypothetical protein
LSTHPGHRNIGSGNALQGLSAGAFSAGHRICARHLGRCIASARSGLAVGRKGTPAIFDCLAARRPLTLRNPSTRRRRGTIGAAAAIPALLHPTLMILTRIRRCHGARVLRRSQQAYHPPAIRIDRCRRASSATWWW